MKYCLHFSGSGMPETENAWNRFKLQVTLSMGFTVYLINPGEESMRKSLQIAGLWQVVYKLSKLLKSLTRQ